MKCKKLFATVVSCGMLVGSLFLAGPATAAADEETLSVVSAPVASAVSSLEAQFYPEGREAEPQFKIKAGKLAVQKIRDYLRSGNIDDAIKNIPGLDPKAKDSLRKNASGVADALDEILYYADLPERAIREKLFNMLSSAGVDYGSAQVIAESVASILSWTVL